MMKTWLASTIVSLLITSSLAVSIPQMPLSGTPNSHQTVPRPRPVPGRNAASFVNETQIMETIHLVISPEIPVVDEPILMYLLGAAPSADNLSSASITFIINWPSNPRDHPMSVEYPLADTPWLRIRKRSGPWTPGNVLVPGLNELLADYTFLGIFTETGRYDVEVRVKLPEPDGRLLFGFNQTFELEETG